MAADLLLSQSITNLDASPIVANTTGAGAAGSKKESTDYVTPTTAGLGTNTSIYKMVRLPMYAKVKRVTLTSDGVLDTSGSPALAVDVGAYYSDSTTDGTPAALQGTSISVNCFAAAIVFGQSATSVNRVAADGAWTVVDRNEPLWVALGLTFGPPNQTGAPPGGFIDVVVAVHTAAATASAHNFNLEVEWVS